jgi:hypothetical protein
MRRTYFLHIPRTAGTSMDDYVQSLGISYQNMGFPLRPKCDPEVEFTNGEHVSVGSLANRYVFTWEWFDGCFKFAFVRNPWDRLVSIWAHLWGYRLKQKRQRESNKYLMSFQDFAHQVVQGRFVKPIGKLVTDDWSQANPQSEWLKWGVDFVGRFENLEKDWISLCTEIGIPPVILGKGNSSNRVPGYRQYYDNELEAKVGEYYKKDIERWEYSF